MFIKTPRDWTEHCQYLEAWQSANKHFRNPPQIWRLLLLLLPLLTATATAMAMATTTATSTKYYHYNTATENIYISALYSPVC